MIVGKRKRAYAKKKYAPRKKGAYSRAPMRDLGLGVVARTFSGMPVSFRSRLTYRDQLHVLNPSAGGLAATHVWAANGLYDPDVTGVGHQPSGFDQIMAMFTKYTVHSAKITVTFLNQDASNSQTVAIATSDSTIGITDIRQTIENGNCVFTELNWKGIDNDMKTLSLYVNVKKFFSKLDIIDTNGLSGTDAANPTQGLFFHVSGAPQATVDSGNISFQTTIEYDVEFSERKRVGIS